MFDPRDLATDPRKPATRPRRDHVKEREARQRSGHRREYDPRTKRQNFQERIDRAVAEIGIYRSVASRDLAEAHFEGHPFAARRAVERMVRSGHVREHTARGPQGGAFTVLTLTERGVERAERVAREQGLDPEQKAWSGLVKPNELQHDVAVFRAARIEQARLLEQGAVLKRIRIDAELKREIARRTEKARARGGKEAADAARFEAAEALGLPVKDGRVQVPDAQLEYQRYRRPDRARERRDCDRALQREKHRRESRRRVRRSWKHRAGRREGGSFPWPGPQRWRWRRPGQSLNRTLKGEAMQPWKISVGLTAIILALALMLAGESFAYLKPYFRIILTDYWMPIAWHGGLALVTLMAALYGAARALGLAGMGRKVDLMERSIRRGEGGQPILPGNWNKRTGGSSPEPE